MRHRPALTIVVVGDTALRLALARCLAGAGIELLTARTLADAMPRRLIRRPSILLVDESAIAADIGDWIEREWIEGRWGRIAMLTLDSPLAASERDWLVNGSAADRLDETIADWRCSETQRQGNTGDAFSRVARYERRHSVSESDSSRGV